MIKKLIFVGVVIFNVLGVSASAEDRCPSGTFPVGGGYCRNIVCDPYVLHDHLWPDTEPMRLLKISGLSCPTGLPVWGQTYIPMR